MLLQKKTDGKPFKFKNFSIKQAFFMSEIFSSRIKAPKQKKLTFFSLFFKDFCSFYPFFQNLKFWKNF